jgi:hypothetical protein
MSRSTGCKTLTGGMGSYGDETERLRAHRERRGKKTKIPMDVLDVAERIARKTNVSTQTAEDLRQMWRKIRSLAKSGRLGEVKKPPSSRDDTIEFIFSFLPTICDRLTDRNAIAKLLREMSDCSFYKLDKTITKINKMTS